MSHDRRRDERALNLIVEALTEDQTEAEKKLKERGVDLDASVDACRMFFQKLKGKIELESAQAELERRDAISGRSRDNVSKLLRSLSMSAQEFLASMQHHGRLSLGFRNIQDLDDEDALDIIEEAGLVDDLENAAKRSD